MWRIRNFFTSISNLIYWFPVIWKEREWDYSFFMNLIAHKLKRIRKVYLKEEKQVCEYYNPQGFHNPTYNADRIETLLNLIEKVQDEYYEDEWQNHIKEIYGPAEYKIEGKRLVEIWEHKYTDRELKEIYKLKHRLFKKAIIKQNKAKELIFKLISHHLYYWWI